MKVILKKDIKGTGKEGDVVKVSDGYARNMLIPKGIAVEATKANIAKLKRDKKQEAEEEAAKKAEAEKIAEKLSAGKVKIETKSGEGGRLFGSITSKDIEKAVKEQLKIEIDRKKIDLKNPIKELGNFDIEVKLYKGIKGIIKLEIID